MGRTSTDNDQDLEMHSVRDEESLPLYSEVTDKDAESVPKPEATSDEVRAFIKNLLVTKRQESPEIAEAVAALWTRGSGQELKSYPPAMYLKIFGSEDGWFLYKESQLMLRHKTDEKKRKEQMTKYVIVLSLIGWEAAMFSIMFAIEIVGFVVFAIFGALIGGMVLLTTIAMCFIPEVKLEDQIEGELRKCMERAVTNESS